MHARASDTARYAVCPSHCARCHGGTQAPTLEATDVQSNPFGYACSDHRRSAAIEAQQSQATPDSEIAAKIRKAIGDDKALAGYLPTLKILVSDGLVTLKGPVKSDADKKAIGQKVDEIAGAKNVMNNLFVSNEAKPAPATP
jgi:hyperosmotically inducible periplasmic protein